MKFGIRDDDTCYLTTPDDLERIYGDIWNTVPVTLACVPVVTSESEVLSTFFDDPEERENFNGRRHIGENEILVEYLRDRIQHGNVGIAQHGFDHAKYDGNPEFVTADNLEERAREGKRILKSTFETDVGVFVPPHVRLSRRGVRAVTAADMDIARGFGPRPREWELEPTWLASYARILSLYIRHGKKYRYPHPLDYGTHQELYCHRLNENTDIRELKAAFEYIRANDGVFVLSVHASALSDVGRQILEKIVSYSNGYSVDYELLRTIFQQYR